MIRIETTEYAGIRLIYRIFRSVGGLGSPEQGGQLPK